MSNDYNPIETPDFDDMPIGQLRQYASHLRVAVAKTATKDEIKQAVINKLKGRSVAELAHEGSTVKPGYAKIRVLSDPMPGAANYPVYVNANGYVCTIPRDVEVIVPRRVVNALNDAIVYRRKQQNVVDANGRETFKEVVVPTPSYPFQVLESVPGPEPMTPYEIANARMMGPRKRYRALFGRYPRPRELTRAIEQKLIKLNDDEQLSAAEESMLGVDQDD